MNELLKFRMKQKQEMLDEYHIELDKMYEALAEKEMGLAEEEMKYNNMFTRFVALGGNIAEDNYWEYASCIRLQKNKTGELEMEIVDYDG